MNKNKVSIKIRFFSNLRDTFNTGEMEVSLEAGSTIRDLIEVFCTSNECRNEILDKSGSLKQYIKVLKNGNSIDVLETMNTMLSDGDVVSFFPQLGGG